MNPETLRKAVELAPGWEWTNDDLISCPWPLPEWHPDDLTDLDQRVFLDALAAELVRVVDGTEDYWVVTTSKDCHVMGGDGKQFAQSIGPGRTENTINAIVEFADQHPDLFNEQGE